MPNRSRVACCTAVVLAVLFVGACGKDGPTGPQPPASVTVSSQSISLNALGSSHQLTATVFDLNGNTITDAGVTWSSSDPSVAKVDATGLVTAVNDGRAEITATAGGVSATAVVMVSQTAVALVVSPQSGVLTEPGEQLQLAATVLDGNDQPVAGAEVDWDSNDPSVASVDTDGIVTALFEGTARITATSDGLSAVVEITVMFADPDRAALVALYNETDGPNWTIRTNWLSDAPLGEWHGVKTGETDRVTELKLPDNGLAGMIPSAIGLLDRMLQLDLSGNLLGGPIPPQIGRLAELSTLILPGNQFSGPLPPEIGNLVNLTSLDLSGNLFSGALPPELGNMKSLAFLFLTDNQFTGSIPPEIGQMTRLIFLDLTANQFTGTLPPELGNLKVLGFLDILYNQLTGPLPPELGQMTDLKTLNLSFNQITGPLPPEWSGMAALQQISLSDNQLTGSLPAELGTMSKLEWITLSNNQFTGPLPPELGMLGNLSTLSLANNRLSGSLPAELGRLGKLRSLNLTGNTDLSGPIPQSFTGLSLQDLSLGGTGVCVPREPAFEEWLQSIRVIRVPFCGDAGGARAYLVQAIQSLQFPVPLVAGEPALLRVFVTANDGVDVPMPTLRVTFYQDGTPSDPIDIPGSGAGIPAGIPLGTIESDLSATANLVVPGEVVMPGLEMVIEIDPEGILDPASGIATRIPEEGRLSVEVMTVPLLDLTLIPFVWTEDPDGTVLPDPDVSAEDEIFWQTRDLLPVKDFMVTLRDPVLTSVDPADENLDIIANDLTMIQIMDGATGHYMGIVRRGGLALPFGKTSLAPFDVRIMAHELGHNMGLFHAPCEVFDADPGYPYANGTIGNWGYDFRDGTLVEPVHFDIMSYCKPGWISDYHFSIAIATRQIEDQFSVVGPPVIPPLSGLLIRGGVDEGGILFLEPSFVVDSPTALPGSDGPYRLAGTDQDGNGLFSLTFDLNHFADREGGIFTFVLPAQPDWRFDLNSITLSGPEGVVELSADDDTAPATALLLDRATGEVRGILRDYFGQHDLAGPTEGTQGARRSSLEPGLDIVISNGIPGPDSW